jgi:hypothetical protein
MSHNIYPVDENEESKSGSAPDSECSSSSEDEVANDQDVLNLRPRKKGLPGLAKLKIFINISPPDFLELKKQFAMHDNQVGVT